MRKKNTKNCVKSKTENYKIQKTCIYCGFHRNSLMHALE